MMESASAVSRLYGFSTESVRWQNETGSWPGPSGVVGGLAGVCNTVDVSSAGKVVVDATVEVVTSVDVVGSVVVDVAVEPVVGVVCASALTPPTKNTKSAPVAIPTAVERRTRPS